jgi:hypothetical protein
VPGSDQPLDEVEGPLQREIRRSGPPRVHPGVASEPRSEAVVSCTNGIAAIRTPFVQGACTNDNGALKEKGIRAFGPNSLFPNRAPFGHSSGRPPASTTMKGKHVPGLRRPDRATPVPPRRRQAALLLDALRPHRQAPRPGGRDRPRHHREAHRARMERHRTRTPRVGRLGAAGTAACRCADQAAAVDRA